MLKINGKTFMNLQEAVQWLLDNNALPFQSTANYAGNTEIGLGTIVNPTPAKVRIGSLIFFADSKVSTVIGLTENGFICSDQYNNLVDDIAYVTGVAINASGHLITTLSDGQTIDAGIIKQVAGFSINGSQHLIVSYNDGTSTDLGAIFSGNITVSGNLTVTGGISGNAVTGNSIIENMTGYSFAQADSRWTPIYVSVCKNGNKITFVIFGHVTQDGTMTGNLDLGTFTIPSSVGAQLYPYYISGNAVIDNRSIGFNNDLDFSVFTNLQVVTIKSSNANIYMRVRTIQNLSNAKYFFRIEQTFLLSENLAS